MLTQVEITTAWPRISAPDGPVPGSRLADGAAVPYGFRFDLQTRPGSFEFADLLKRRARIAAGLRTAPTSVLVDPHPSRDESRALLTVLTDNPIERPVAFTGPRYVDGRIEIGPYQDASGWAEFLAKDTTGVYGGLITGEQGSGKSSCFENVGLSLLSSGEWFPVYLDGDESGSSSPFMNEHMPVAGAGRGAAYDQLERIEKALTVRGLVKATLTVMDGRQVPMTNLERDEPIRALLPSPEYPGLMWMIDELYRLAEDKEFMQRLEKVLRVGRKFGVTATTASQSLGRADYGGSTALRGLLANRNVFAFRHQSKQEKGLVSGLQVSPATLPEGGGFAYAVRGGRTAMLRAAWSKDMAGFAKGLPEVELDLDTAQVFDGAKEDPVAVRRRAATLLADLRKTYPEPEPEHAPEPEPEPEPAPVPWATPQPAVFKEPAGNLNSVPENASPRERRRLTVFLTTGVYGGLIRFAIVVFAVAYAVAVIAAVIHKGGTP